MTSRSSLTKLASRVAEEGEVRGEAARVIQDLVDVVGLTSELSNSNKLAKAVTIATSMLTLGTAVKSVWNFYKKNSAPHNFTIKITEDDAIFEIVEDWFMEALPQEKQLSIYAHSIIERGSESGPGRRRPRGSRASGSMESELVAMLDTPDLSNEKGSVTIDYSFDGTMVQKLEVAGHQVEIFTHVPETFGNANNGGKKAVSASRSLNIVCKTVEARNAVLKEVEKQSQFLAETQPTMYVSTRWGDFRKRNTIQKRSRDSVILKEGQMDQILDYLKGFHANREAFLKADIPFRTGMLLYGEPGSGKTSTALAIANEMKMNVYIISLSSLSSDEALSDCFSVIPPNSIIILEDIDIVNAVKDRDEDKDGEDAGVTMAGMLNVLDGFQSPHGVITIMTTNRLEVMDDAIVRPGRVDMMVNLDCLNDYQLRGLCEYFMGIIPKDLPSITPENKITSAEIMGIIRKHIPEFAEAADDIVKFVDSKVLTSMKV